MKSLLKPHWILITNTLPTVLLFIIFISNYSIIHSLLTDKNKEYWLIFGSALIALSLMNIAYYVLLLFKKKNISNLYGIIVLLAYTTYIYFYSEFSRQIIPFNIPSWMISNDLLIYVWALLMPTLIHSMLIIVIQMTSENKKHKAWLNFLFTIITPIAFYFFVELFIPLLKPLDGAYKKHFLSIIYAVGIIIFLFFFIRWVYIMAIWKRRIWEEYEILLKIFFTLAFPFLGLLINNDQMIFGDFNNSWFYILTFINGILLNFPNSGKKIYRLILFSARGITFSYIFYFFLVFLPYLPLSIILIALLFVGVLMLTPQILFVYQIQIFSKDYKFLRKYYSANILVLISIISFMTLPVIITISNLMDKHTLNESLEYIYNPDFSKDYEIDKSSVYNIISNIRSNKRRDYLFEHRQTPYLSFYYNWIVLGNLTVSEKKLKKMEQIFLGVSRSKSARRSRFTVPDSTEIIDTKTKSSYNYNKNYWVSWVDLEIKNFTNSSRQAEYHTNIELPAGCWIDDYYLYIGDRKEKGILTEKKTAIWVYSRIRNTRKDPGILHYTTGNNIKFRVFPFRKDEVRKTGIKFIHKEPTEIKLDGKIIKLGNNSNQKHVDIVYNNTRDVIYFSPDSKASLSKIKRKPYYHFIVDKSINSAKNNEEFTNRIKRFLKDNNVEDRHHKISFVNTFIETDLITNDWVKKNAKIDNSGGFYLERAIKKCLIDSYLNDGDYFPIFIIVTDNLDKAILENNFIDYKFTFPDNDIFYTLEHNNKLNSHSLLQNPKKIINKNTRINPAKKVLVWKNEFNRNIYLSDDCLPDIALNNPTKTFHETSNLTQDWNSGLTIQGKYLYQLLYNKGSEKKWLEIIKNSFQSKILSPYTSYIVVENKVQKAMIKARQDKILSGNKNLDISDVSRMSEPELYILILILGLLLKTNPRLRSSKRF